MFGEYILLADTIYSFSRELEAMGEKIQVLHNENLFKTIRIMRGLNFLFCRDTQADAG